MAKRLTSLLINQITWRLPLKAIVFFLGLILVEANDFAVGALVIFAFLLLGIYFSETPERKTTRASFWFLAVIAPVALSLLVVPVSISGEPGPRLAGLPLALMFVAAATLFVLLGLNHFVFKNRVAVFGFLNTVLLTSAFAVYFWLPPSLYRAGALFLAVTLLFKETFNFGQAFPGRRGSVIAAAIGLVALEVAWICGFLPLGFLNGAVFLTLFLVLLRDGLLVASRGLFGPDFLFRELVFFLVLTVAIFAVSQWTI